MQLSSDCSRSAFCCPKVLRVPTYTTYVFALAIYCNLNDLVVRNLCVWGSCYRTRETTILQIVMCLCICKGECNHLGIILPEICSIVLSVQPEPKWEKLEYDFKVSFPISGSHEMNEVQQHINEFDKQIHKPTHISFIYRNLW